MLDCGSEAHGSSSAQPLGQEGVEEEDGLQESVTLLKPGAAVSSGGGSPRQLHDSAEGAEAYLLCMGIVAAAKCPPVDSSIRVTRLLLPRLTLKMRRRKSDDLRPNYLASRDRAILQNVAEGVWVAATCGRTEICITLCDWLSDHATVGTELPRQVKTAVAHAMFLAARFGHPETCQVGHWGLV